MLHHHEVHEKICSDKCDKSKAHIHETKYEIKHCNLCDFTFHVAELSDNQRFTLFNKVSIYSFCCTFHKVFLSAELYVIHSRGPPEAIH